MFTNEEIQYILNALNEETKRTGLQNAQMALVIVAKFQAEAQRMKSEANEATEKSTPKLIKNKNSSP